MLEIDGETSTGSRCGIGVSVLDTPADFGWQTTFEALTRDAVSNREREVDGRPARIVETKRDDRTRLHAIVLAADALFVIDLDRVDADADRAMFEAFLETVDFDVSRD